MSALKELWAGAAVQCVGAAWCLALAGAGSRAGAALGWSVAAWAPVSWWEGREGVSLGTQPNLALAQPQVSGSCAELLLTAPVSPLFSLLFLFLQYHMEVRKLLCSLKKERRNKYFYLAKIFVLTCILKTCTAQSRSASVSQHCCRKQPRRPILYLYPGSW